MKSMQELHQEKRNILDLYELMPSIPGLLPQSEITVDSVREKKASLQNERFYVSVCGQMKAGKSTLLNALLFDKPVLPVDDTVMTAKITLVEYREQAGICVSFYSSEEWEQYKRNLDSDELKAQWEEDINESICQGVYEDEVVTSSGLTKQDSLENLQLYVSLPKQGGIYSPFVKSVTVYTPNPFLQDVIIVDTPGINDTNKLRANVTKHWIQKADAIVYVSYAGQAMAQPDIDFINEYLLHVPSQRRIIAINKVDCVSSEDELKESIAQLARHKEQSIQQVFSKTTAICYVSALGAFIDKMLQKGIKLSEDLLEMKEILEEKEKDFLQPQHHRFTKLRQLIEQKLIQNKGEHIIQSHKTFLKNLFTRALHQLDKQLNYQKDQLDLLGQSKKQLEEESMSITQKIETFKHIERSTTEEIHNQLERFKTAIQNSVTEIKRDIMGDFQGRLQRETKSIENLKYDVSWMIKDCIDSQQRRLSEKIAEEAQSFAKSMASEIKKLKNILEDNKILSFGLIDAMIHVPISSVLEDLRNLSFPPDHIDKIITEATAWYQRLFKTQAGLDTARTAVISGVSEVLERTLCKRSVDMILEKSGNKVKQTISSINEEIGKALRDKDESIREILENMSSKEEMSNEAKVKISKIDQQQQYLRQQQQQLGLV